MSTLDAVYAAFDEMSVTHLYHFTAVTNIPSIRKHRGLYPKSAHANRDITCMHCSDTWSRLQDQQQGLDHYIHLSLHPEHAMVKEAHSRLDANGVTLGIVRLHRSVIELEGVLFCGDISNISHLRRIPIAESFENIRRLTPGKLKRAEILVPKRVPFEYFVDSWRWNGDQTRIPSFAQR